MGPPGSPDCRSSKVGIGRFTLATMAVDTEPEGIFFHLLGDDARIEGEGRTDRSRGSESNRESVDS
jgi:hypothetical protein